MKYEYFEGKSLTHDWVSGHVGEWEEILADPAYQDARVLEIGSFEGRSALFFLQFLPESRICCIDTFAGSREHLTSGSPAESDMASVERAAQTMSMPSFASASAMCRLMPREAPVTIATCESDKP